MSFGPDFDLNLHSERSSDGPPPALNSVFHESFRSNHHVISVASARCSQVSREEVATLTETLTPSGSVQTSPPSGSTLQNGETMSPPAARASHAPLATTEEDYISSVSDLSSRQDLRSPSATASTDNLLPPVTPSTPDPPANATRDFDASDPDLRSSMMTQWKSVPGDLHRRSRRPSMDLCSPIPLQARSPPHHDSGVSGFSGYSGASDRRSITDRRRLASSTTDVSRLSAASSSAVPTTDVTIMHTEVDINMARHFKKKVKKVCKDKKKKADVMTWDERCTAGINVREVKHELLSTCAVLFFIVTENFLEGYQRKPFPSTVTGVMYEVLEETKKSPGHLVVPVKLRSEQPPETSVAVAFPLTKALKMEDTKVKEEILKSINEGGVVKKTGRWKKFKSKLSSSTQEIYPAMNISFQQQF